MKRQVFIERTNEEKQLILPEDMRIHELLSMLDIPAEDVLVALDGRIRTEDTRLGRAKRIEILSVISGG